METKAKTASVTQTTHQKTKKVIFGSPKIEYFFALLNKNHSVKRSSQRIKMILDSVAEMKRKKMTFSEGFFVHKECLISLPFEAFIIQADKSQKTVFEQSQSKIKSIALCMEDYRGPETIQTFMEKVSQVMVFILPKNQSSDLNCDKLKEWYCSSYPGTWSEEAGAPFIKEIIFEQNYFYSLILPNILIFKQIKKKNEHNVEGTDVEIFDWDDLDDPSCPLSSCKKQFYSDLEKLQNGKFSL